MSIEVSTVYQFLASWMTPQPAAAIDKQVRQSLESLVRAGRLYDWSYLPDGDPVRVGPLVVTAITAAVAGMDPWLQAWQKAVATEGDVRLFLGYSCYLDIDRDGRGAFLSAATCATCEARGTAGTLAPCPGCAAVICRRCQSKHSHPAPVPTAPARRVR